VHFQREVSGTGRHVEGEQGGQADVGIILYHSARGIEDLAVIGHAGIAIDYLGEDFLQLPHFSGQLVVPQVDGGAGVEIVEVFELFLVDLGPQADEDELDRISAARRDFTSEL